MNIYTEVPEEYTELFDIAGVAMGKAYAPYSHFQVGAALLCASGNIYSGCNIENSSYPAGICAERAAVSCAVANGERSFKTIAIVGGPYGRVSRFCAPCGICRQVLREFCEPAEMKVVMFDGMGVLEYSLEQLIPMPFTPESLMMY